MKKTLGLKTAQIYKWGYDRKKLAEKENIDAEYSKSSGKSKHDVYMTDRHINDYNDAVLKICDSISKHPSKEGLVRKEEVSESCQNSLKSTEPNKDNKTKRKIFSNANTHSATLSELSEIVPSKPLEMDNRTENEDMIWLTSEKLEPKDEVEEIIIDDSDYIEESWNELHSDDTYNYIKLHWDEYNQIIPPNNYGFINAEELEQSIIDWELSSEAEFAMNRMDDF